MQQATSARGHRDSEVVMEGFADLGQIMADRERDDGRQALLLRLVPMPSKFSSRGHWACYLWQHYHGTWDDVAEALELPYSETHRLARRYCRRENVVWPLQKRVGKRKIGRDTL